MCYPEYSLIANLVCCDYTCSYYLNLLYNTGRVQYNCVEIFMITFYNKATCILYKSVVSVSTAVSQVNTHGHFNITCDFSLCGCLRGMHVWIMYIRMEIATLNIWNLVMVTQLGVGIYRILYSTCERNTDPTGTWPTSPYYRGILSSEVGWQACIVTV